MIIKEYNSKEIIKPKDCADIMIKILCTEDKIDQDKEHFWVIHLGNRSKIKAIELVSLGNINASIVSPREVFTRAVAIRSTSIILVHNHPGEDVVPSQEDIEVTEKLVDGGSILGIPVLDHVIISAYGKNFKSMRECQFI